MNKESGTSRDLNVCIVVPTYNESKNIVKLLDQIFENEKLQKEKGNNDSISVLVVDDSSPDGTADIVRQYSYKNGRVHLLLRKEKNGLGAAYIAGIKHAMSMLNPDVIMEMDADLSHDPKDISRLIEGIKQGADFVIGSRYINGGSIPDDWGIKRKVVSSLANSFTRNMLSMREIRDCSGGFRAIRASLLEKINLDALNVKGYAFQASLLEAALRHDAVVKEVPIAFADRTQGESKMGVSDMVEWATILLRIRISRMLAFSEEPDKYDEAIAIKN